MSAEADVKLDNFKGLFSLDGKVAVVTGGSRGLGLHAASGYAHRDTSSSHTLGLQLIDSSKLAPRRSSLHRARLLLARKHAPPSMRFLSQAKLFPCQPISPNRLRSSVWSLRSASTLTMSISYSRTRVHRGVHRSTRLLRAHLTKSWT